MRTKTMKKIITLMLSVLLMFGLAACGNEQQAADGGAANPSSGTEDQNGAESEMLGEAAGASSEEETETEGNAEENASDAAKTENMENASGSPLRGSLDAIRQERGKTLVVYYSASGNTKEAAEYIAAASGGDLFELEPEEAYTDEDLDWTNEDSRVCREHENEEERNIALVSAEVPDWDSYETVFIGYPIWWGIAAWPVNGFITANDFTGKTVIPFCTSASSGLGESGELLEEMAGTGNWLDGERFSSGVSEEDVKVWIDSIGM